MLEGTSGCVDKAGDPEGAGLPRNSTRGRLEARKDSCLACTVEIPPEAQDMGQIKLWCLVSSFFNVKTPTNFTLLYELQKLPSIATVLFLSSKGAICELC